MPETKSVVSSTEFPPRGELKERISASVKLRRRHRLNCHRSGYVEKGIRQKVAHRLPRDEEQKLIKQV